MLIMPVYIELLQAVMVAIGTNNLGSGMTPEDTVVGIKAVVKVCCTLILACFLCISEGL